MKKEGVFVVYMYSPVDCVKCLQVINAVFVESNEIRLYDKIDPWPQIQITISFTVHYGQVPI